MGKSKKIIATLGSYAGYKSIRKPSNPQITFESTWKTNNAGTSNDDQISLPLEATGTYDFLVKWGDGSSDTITVWNQAEVTHTYASAGTYTVKITGTINGWCFNNGGDKLKLLSVESWGILLLGNSGMYFYGCANLVINATDKLKASDMTTFFGGFYGCISLTAIPSTLFDNNILINTFEYCFYGCTSLTTIPDGLFDYNTLVTTFKYCFRSCFLTSIPNGLFDYNIAVTTFRYCFYGNNLTTIPSGLFDYNTLVTEFAYCFRDCFSLTTIPSGLFDHNTLVTNFSYCLSYCTSLTAIPSGLFDNNNLVTDFEYCFDEGTALTGLAPELWLREPEPAGTDCFSNATGLSNYGDIPETWK